MSDASTQRMISAFFQDAEPSGFLTGLFKAPRENFHSSEEVEIDIVRETEQIAIPVIDGNGYTVQILDSYTNKRFKPPVYKVEAPIRADDLYSREPGVNPFADQSFQAKLMARAMRNGRSLVRSLQRSIELQAAQVLQTGIVSLTDSLGNVLFSLDFGLAATHQITVGTAWDQAGATIAADLIAACDVVRDDGKLDADQVIMDADAFEAAMANTDFRARFDGRRADLGAINPMRTGGTGGGNYRGTIDVGSHKLDLWTYGGRYTHPVTGVSTRYITQGNVIVRSSRQRLDATFGNIPLIVAPNQRLLPYLPRRMSSSDMRADVFTNVWTDAMGETLHLGVGSRPLLIPTQIDGYAVLDGTVTP